MLFFKGSTASTRSGFTIVELLIVIVVIAILAAVVVVSYNGISNRAEVSAVKSDLVSHAKKLEADRIIGGDSFSPSIVSPLILKETSSASLHYRYGTTTSFCLDAVSKKNTANQYYIESSQGVSSIQDGTCPATSSEVEPRCVGGGAYLAVKQINYMSESLDINIITPYGNRLLSVAPGANNYMSFNTHLTSFGSGLVTITLSGVGDSSFSNTRFHAYDAKVC